MFINRINKHTYNYNTFGMSILTMIQLFLGENWHEVMKEAVQDQHAAIAFFVIYVLVVGILFSQLFVGVIIGTFHTAERLRKTSHGHVLMAMQDVCQGWPLDSVEKLLEQLTGIAVGLNDHRNLLLKIQSFDGISAWSVLQIQRRWRGYCWRRLLKGVAVHNDLFANAKVASNMLARGCFGSEQHDPVVNVPEVSSVRSQASQQPAVESSWRSCFTPADAAVFVAGELPQLPQLSGDIPGSEAASKGTPAPRGEFKL